MSKGLQRLEKKKLDVGLNRLTQFGIDVDRWLAMLGAPDAVMQRLADAWPVRRPSYVYDAATVSRILGLPCKSSEPVPQAADGEVVVWYDGWTLGELVATGKVVNYLSKEREAWKAPAGYYHLLLPVPESNDLTWDDQAGNEKTSLLARLYAAFSAAPTPIGATALAVHLGVTGEDLLKGDFARCAEALPYGVRAVLNVNGGRVKVGCYWGGSPYGRVWLAGARKS